MDFSDSDNDDSSWHSSDALPVVTGGVDEMDDALFGGLGASDKKLTQTTSAPAPGKKVSFTGQEGPTSSTTKTGGILKTTSAQHIPAPEEEKPTVAEKPKFDFNLDESDDNLDELLAPFTKSSNTSAISKKQEKAKSPSTEKEFEFSDSVSAPNLHAASSAKKIEKPSTSMPEFEFTDDDDLLKSEPSEAPPEPRKMQPVASKSSVSSTGKMSDTSVKKPEKVNSSKSNEDIFASATSVPGFSDIDISESSISIQKPPAKKSSTRAASPPQESHDESFLADLLGTKKPEETTVERPKRAVSEPVSLGRSENGDGDTDDDTFNMFIKPKKKASSQATKRPTPIIEASPQVSNPPSPPPEKSPSQKPSFIPPPVSNYPAVQTTSAAQQVSESHLEELNSLRIEIQQLKSALSVKDAQLHELSSNNVGNNDRLSKELNLARQEANLAQQEKLNEAQRCQKRLDEAFVDHQAHVNRMKQAHMEASSMMRDEQVDFFILFFC